MSVCITTETWSLVIAALQERERERERERGTDGVDRPPLIIFTKRERFLSNKYTC